MSLECLNTIILDNLAIHIDLSNLNSWNTNTGLTSISLTKWNQAISSDLNLLDFGLTGYDNGLLDNMLSGITLTANDNKFKLYRVGYNTTAGTSYSGYTITTVDDSTLGRYFSLDGGFLQGYFKLEGYEYEVLSPRYNEGITIETLIELESASSGIFFLMGTRAEDKYNPYFSGETGIVGQSGVHNSTGGTDYVYSFSGITTSEGNYLNAYIDEEVIRSAMIRPEDDLRVTTQKQFPQVNNIKNNVIAFELTNDKRLAYKYIDDEGNLQYNESTQTITKTGWSVIDITFTPDEEIKNYDPLMYQCYVRRTGVLRFYLDGRLFWKVKDFTEWYSSPINNDKEKQLGVPFTISWGGGSFGLKHSYHFNSGDTSATLVQDPTKDSLFIEDYFSSTYIGNIQKLRVYDRALTPSEVLHNTLIEKGLLAGYGLTTVKGGRIISKSTPITNEPVPAFSDFNIVIASPFEVGTTISGLTQFTWGTTASLYVATTSIGISQDTGTLLGNELPNDGMESLTIDTISDTGQTTHSWTITGCSTQATSFNRSVSKCSIHPVYYGVLTGSTRPAVTSDLVTGGTKTVVNSDGTVTVTFNSAPDEYSWLAIPSTSTSKTCWYVDTVDNGCINDDPADKYPDECVISVTSGQACWSDVNYKVYMSGFFGEITDPMQFRNS